MKTYDRYKDSHVKWIGLVPEHWEVRKLSLTYPKIGSGTTPNTGNKEYYTEDADCFWLQTGDLNDSLITSTSKKITRQAIKECGLSFYPQGSVVIAMYGATIGKVGLLEIETTTNQACCVLPKSKYADDKFSFYLCLSAKRKLLIEGMGGGQPNISQDIIKKLRIPLPPLQEQRAIAAYLDERCGRIDRVVEAERRRIALLDELRQSVITHAVTRGLNPDAPLKDSQVEWIGLVPEHWEVCKLKNKYTFHTGGTPPSGQKKFYENGTYKWANISDLRQEIVYETAKLLTYEGVDYCSMSISPKGSLMYSFKLSVGQVAFCGDDMYTNEAIATFEKGTQSLKYLYYMAPVLIEKNAETNIYGAAILNQDLIKNAPITLPPLQEQQAIASYLDTRTAALDAQKAKSERRIALLNELKQSIITEAVTGKVKIA